MPFLIRERILVDGVLVVDRTCPKVTPEGLCSIHDEQRPAVCSTFECPQPVE